MNERLFACITCVQPTEQNHNAMDMFKEMMMAVCIKCGDAYEHGRAVLGYRVCLSCGDTDAHKVKHCIVPLNKSNYIAVTNFEMLKQLNPKRTT